MNTLINPLFVPASAFLGILITIAYSEHVIDCEKEEPVNVQYEEMIRVMAEAEATSKSKQK